MVVAAVGTAGSAGTGVDLTAPLAKAHASGVAFTVYATDPTGDMTKVFGEGSPSGTKARPHRSRHRYRGPRDGADRLRRDRDPLRRRWRDLRRRPNAKPDPLPDEQGGYTGFKGLFGAKYVNPAINGGAGRSTTRTATRSSTRSASGFPGFDGMYARNTLGSSRRCRNTAFR